MAGRDGGTRDLFLAKEHGSCQPRTKHCFAMGDLKGLGRVCVA